LAIGLVLAILAWLAAAPPGAVRRSESGPASAPATTQPVLRLGLIPERDIFRQRQMHRAVARYVGEQLGRSVELVTASRYQGMLDDLQHERIDMAFMGSLITTVAVDQLGARLVARPELTSGESSYRGVVVTRADSSITRVADLAGKRVTLAPATMGGSLFAVCEFSRLGLLSRESAPTLIAVGSHEDVVREVIEGRAAAGFLKDLRLAEYLRSAPAAQLRQIAASEAVPENALVIRSGLAADLLQPLRRALLGMHTTDAGRAALKEFGARAFRECRIEEYAAVYDMVEAAGDYWPLVGMETPPPRRPPGVPAKAAPSTQAAAPTHSTSNPAPTAGGR
jgi:phosphonate transport system substrate-binding protein